MDDYKPFLIAVGSSGCYSSGISYAQSFDTKKEYGLYVKHSPFTFRPRVKNIITQEWSGMTTKQYRNYKGLKKESLRDNMTNMEIALNMLAEASATELSKQRDPKGFNQQKKVAKDGGSVAKAARNQLESKLGHKVISPAKASDYLPPITNNEDNEDKI